MQRTTRTYDRLLRYVLSQPWAVLPSTLIVMREILSMRAGGSSASLLDTQLWVALIPLVALAGSRWIVETRGRALPQ